MKCISEQWVNPDQNYTWLRKAALHRKPSFIKLIHFISPVAHPRDVLHCRPVSEEVYPDLQLKKQTAIEMVVIFIRSEDARI